MTGTKLLWQSKTILLLVFPIVGADVVLETHWWLTQLQPVVVWTLGLSTLLGLVAYRVGSATPGAAVGGMAITASLMYASVSFPFAPTRTALLPVVVLLVLTSLATRAGRKRKENLGTAESRGGRTASQVAANLGAAALVSNPVVQSWLLNHDWGHRRGTMVPVLVLGLAALAEAAADTVSSEVGQVLSGHPRMITTLRRVNPGTDGAMSLSGTAVGMVAAGAVALTGSWALGGGSVMLALSWSGGVSGLLFDSLLGATAERRGWLNNDAVNFLSTLSAAAVALGLLILAPV